MYEGLLLKEIIKKINRKTLILKCTFFTRWINVCFSGNESISILVSMHLQIFHFMCHRQFEPYKSPRIIDLNYEGSNRFQINF